jgi:ER membrane protein complex subunit 1
LATLDGRITAVDRNMVDPRRPIGPLKDLEKKEGLRQYSELIPTVSLMTLSYNRTVDGVAFMIAAPSYLESQSLVLAFGGPDVFFARTSPSRGFDLLPEEFNRLLLTLVVVAIFVVMAVTQTMASKKVMKQGWV